MARLRVQDLPPLLECHRFDTLRETKSLRFRLKLAFEGESAFACM